MSVQPAAPGWYRETAAPFLDRFALPLALALILIASVRIVSTYKVLGITFDEPSHIACGVQFLAQHVYKWEPLHPPLARTMVSIGPYLEGARPWMQPIYSGIKLHMGLDGVQELYHSGDPPKLLALARVGTLPFFILGSLVVFFWARRSFGGAVAVLAVALFTLLPPVLAHGGLATTDMGLTACLGAAFLTLLIWVERPTMGNAVLFGVATAAATLCKLTTLGFFPAAAVFALIVYWWIERPRMPRVKLLVRERAASFGVAVGIAVFLIWAGYLFSFGTPGGWHTKVPAPEFFDGITMATHRTETGGGYLLGTYSEHGFWYFFLVAIALKTPLAFLLLLGIGLGVAWKKRAGMAVWMPFTFAMGTLLPAMTSHLNLGIRHVLPVYIGFAILAALGLDSLLSLRGKAWALPIAAVLLLWQIVGPALHHPDTIAYFNELVGSEPENVMVDSDFDWGQSTPLLARRLRELNVQHIGFASFDLDSDHLQKWPGLPPSLSINPGEPREGWTVVSPTLWHVAEYGLYHKYPTVRPWFSYIPPVERVGSYLLYYVPPGTLRR